MIANAYMYDGTWPVVINTLIQQLLTKNVLKEKHDLVTRASQWLNEDGPEFETRFSKATRRCWHILTAVKKVNCYVCNLNPSIREEILEEPRRMHFNVCSNLIEIRRISAAKERS